MNEPVLAVGQVWHFFARDVIDCNDLYLLLRPISTVNGLWEAFDLLSGELTYICPCGGGEWTLM